jgi:hypothetical protein
MYKRAKQIFIFIHTEIAESSDCADLIILANLIKPDQKRSAGGCHSPPAWGSINGPLSRPGGSIPYFYRLLSATSNLF